MSRDSNMNFDPYQYQVAVRRVVIDDIPVFEATVRELPDVVSYGDSQEEAYEIAIDAIEGLFALNLELGRSFPEPAKYETEFSGRVTLRMRRQLHATLARTAEQESVSLNSLICDALSEFVGSRDASRAAHVYVPQSTSVLGTLRKNVDFGSANYSYLREFDPDVNTASYGSAVKLATVNVGGSEIQFKEAVGHG